MKQISGALADHLKQESTTLCRCWKITLKDGTIIRLTDHDEDVPYDELTLG